MKIGSNVTDKILGTEGGTFMLECNIVYVNISNWFLGSDYVPIANNMLQKVI